jgi:hypothetical protein
MPTVFVHPPEDEAMPWCAFDGSQEDADSNMAVTTPEMETHQLDLDDQPLTAQPPLEKTTSVPHCSQADNAAVSTHRRGSSYPSLSSRKLLALSSIPESPKRPKERDDDDIVEVMKVRRGEGMPDVAYANGSVPTLKRSKTLRSRAAQALRSIKNVRKAPRTRPTLEQHVVPAKENGQHSVKVKAKVPAPVQTPPTAEQHRAKAPPIPTQSSIPRLKKRASQPLSNLFGVGLGLVPGGSEASPSTSDPAGFGVSPSHSASFRTLPYSRSKSASTPALQMFADEPARPTSPSFSIRGTRQKFSFVNLQSIFSGITPSASEQQQTSESQRPEADIEVDEDEPTSPRTIQTPVDEGWDSGEDYESPRRHVGPGTMRRPSDEDSYPEEQEFSFETRINSLHFDSFSFDADAF